MNPTAEASRIVVVGAGVIGLSCALELRRARPECEVVVVDAGRVGDGTTPAGAGFVAPWATVVPHLGESGLRLADYSLGRYRELVATGVELRLRSNGNLVLFNERSSFDAAVSVITAGPQHSRDTQVVDAGEVGELTSGLVDTDRVVGGFFMPRGIQLETGLVLAELARRAAEAGIEIEERSPVHSVAVAGGRVEGVELADGLLAAASVVLASGAWLGELLVPLGCTLPLLPFVATRFVSEDLGVSPTMPTIQAKDFPLWIRESQGGLTWGSTAGYAPVHRLAGALAAFDPQTRLCPDLVEAMVADTERLSQVFPALARARVTDVLQGMPVFTVDGQFVAGPVPGCRGLWAVGGDNESGVSHGPGLGRLISDLVTGSADPLCDPTPYRLDRFEPLRYPDAEAVGQEYVRRGDHFIADVMMRTAPGAS